MQILGIIALLLMMGSANVQAYQKSDWLSLGTLADSQVRSEGQRTGDGDESFRDRGRLFGSFRRTAARLQEYDGLDPTGDLDRDGLDWTRQPISQARSTQEIKGERPGFIGWAKKVSIPPTASEYLIFFTMKNCQPCRRMYPIIEALEDEGYEIYVVPQETNLDVVRQHDVSSYPTILIYENGGLVKRMGFTTRATILKYLKKPTDLPPLPDPFEPPPDRVDYDFVDGPNYRLW